MDTHTLELLEFDKVRALVAAQAACSLGKDAARRMEPSRDPGEIRDRQALTTEMAEALAVGPDAPVRRPARHPPAWSAGPRSAAMLDAEELAETVETLRAIGNLDRWLDRVGDEFPRLGGLKPGVGEFSGVANAIEACLDSRGKILDTASRKLSALRREIGQVEERIQETLRRMLRSTEIKRILRYPNFTMVGHHYVLPIAKEHRGEIQGSVHRTSASNETVFVEPQAIAEHSAQLSFLRAKEAKEIRRILRWLSAQVGQVADSLLGTPRDPRRARPDLRPGPLQPRLPDDARPTSTRRASSPSAGPGTRSSKPSSAASRQRRRDPAAGRRGRTASRRRRPPPPRRAADGRADRRPPRASSSRSLVVTGPNTGGKTVALKTVGLLAVMAQAGPAHPGAPGVATAGLRRRAGRHRRRAEPRAVALDLLVARPPGLGDPRARRPSSRSSCSTRWAPGPTPPRGRRSAGRSSTSSTAIGCRAIVTTHIGDLKTYAFTNPRAENAAVEFDLETLRPRYRLHIGDIGQSNALQIARRLNLPEHLVARAATYLERRRRGEHVPELEIVQKLRKDAEDARQSALAAQAEAERSREALNQRLADLQRQAENDARIAEARARLQPGDRVVVPRFGYDRPGRVVKLDPRKKTRRRRHRPDAVGRRHRRADPPDHPHARGRPRPTKAKAGAGRSRRSRLEDFAGRAVGRSRTRLPTCRPHPSGGRSRRDRPDAVTRPSASSGRATPSGGSGARGGTAGRRAARAGPRRRPRCRRSSRRRCRSRC